jgi:hypothetical protein
MPDQLYRQCPNSWRVLRRYSRDRAASPSRAPGPGPRLEDEIAKVGSNLQFRCVDCQPHVLLLGRNFRDCSFSVCPLLTCAFATTPHMSKIAIEMPVLIMFLHSTTNRRFHSPACGVYGNIKRAEMLFGCEGGSGPRGTVSRGP